MLSTRRHRIMGFVLYSYPAVATSLRGLLNLGEILLLIYDTVEMFPMTYLHASEKSVVVVAEWSWSQTRGWHSRVTDSNPSTTEDLLTDG
ncbi:hypothetical protein TNCV_3635151 [Trichonephila clavipes]|nr:hypothetical protein TNCV_3635151 [Trichonephila clavipes]